MGVRALLSLQLEWIVCGEAVDGIDALEKARDLRPGIILMDVSMPRMNGIEATRILSRELPESKVVIVSQNDRAVIGRQAEDAGAGAFVAKSDLAHKLIPTIAEVFGRRKPPAISSVGDKMRGDTTHETSTENSTNQASVPVESILRTEELRRRPSRPPDYEKENRALVALAEASANSPQTVLQVLAETILEVCSAGSAGISLLSTDDGGRGSTGRRLQEVGRLTSVEARLAISDPVETCSTGTVRSYSRMSNGAIHTFSPCSLRLKKRFLFLSTPEGKPSEPYGRWRMRVIESSMPKMSGS